MNSATTTPPTDPTPQGAANDGSRPPTPDEMEALSRMHREAANLNRLTIRTNFQQAIQDALLAKDEKARRYAGALCEAFLKWAEAEAKLGLN